MELVNYKVHMASSDDSDEGRIWIKHKDLEGKIQGKRPIVCIKGEKFKPIYVEALYADYTYLKKRGMDTVFGENENVIFISAWYRNKLKIEAEKFPVKGSGGASPVTIDLDVKPLRPLNLRALLYLYPRDHPQALVLTANMMAIVAFGLGVLGIGLGFASLKDWLGPFWALFGLIILVVVGFVITLLGVIGLIRR